MLPYALCTYIVSNGKIICISVRVMLFQDMNLIFFISLNALVAYFTGISRLKKNSQSKFGIQGTFKLIYRFADFTSFLNFGAQLIPFFWLMFTEHMAVKALPRHKVCWTSNCRT